VWKNIIVFSLAVFCTSAQDGLQSIPSNLRAPADQKLIFQAHGIGDQIYTCKVTDNKYTWTLKAPDAQLLGSDGQVFGRHFAGPAWEARDGSRVVGKPVASVASPNPSAVPWLLLVAIRHDGHGSMDQVLSIQRLNTKGGKAPGKGCDGSHAGEETRIAYEGDYYFYGHNK
jgi:hypothetical protein